RIDARHVNQVEPLDARVLERQLEGAQLVAVAPHPLREKDLGRNEGEPLRGSAPIRLRKVRSAFGTRQRGVGGSLHFDSISFSVETTQRCCADDSGAALPIGSVTMQRRGSTARSFAPASSWT